jgi:hypothetical protein
MEKTLIDSNATTAIVSFLQALAQFAPIAAILMFALFVVSTILTSSENSVLGSWIKCHYEFKKFKLKQDRKSVFRGGKAN